MRINRFSAFTAFFCAALVAIIAFSGHGHSVEIQDRLLCHALGIDFSGGEYEISAQVFKPSGAGSDTPVDITQSNIEIVSGRGKTVSDALEQCENRRGKEIFLGHLQLICFGKSVDLSSPRQLCEFCLKDKSVYLGVDICLSDTTAKELMSAELSNDMLATENYVSVIEKNAEKSRTVRCRLLDLFNSEGKGKCAVMPVLAVVRPSENEKELTELALKVTNTALITGGKAADVQLEPDSSAGLFLLASGSKEADMVLQNEDWQFSVRVSKKSCSTRVEQGSGGLLYKARLTVVVHRVKDTAFDTDAEEVAQLVGQRLKEQFDTLFAQCENEAYADICGIRKLLRQSFPKTFLDCENGLETLYRSAHGELEIECLVE